MGVPSGGGVRADPLPSFLRRSGPLRPGAGDLFNRRLPRATRGPVAQSGHPRRRAGGGSAHAADCGPVKRAEISSRRAVICWGCSSVTRCPVAGMTRSEVARWRWAAGRSRRGGRKASCSPVATRQGTDRHRCSVSGRRAGGARLERQWRATRVYQSMSVAGGVLSGATNRRSRAALWAWEGRAIQSMVAASIAGPTCRRVRPPVEIRTRAAIRGESQARAIAPPREWPQGLPGTGGLAGSSWLWPGG